MLGLLISIKACNHLLSLMLSIQYVYERVILFRFACQTPLPLLVLAAAKVQLFFKPASFFKKKFLSFFPAYQSLFPACQYPIPFGLGGQR